MSKNADSAAELPSEQPRPIPQADRAVKPAPEMQTWTPELVDERYDNVPCTD